MGCLEAGMAVTPSRTGLGVGPGPQALGAGGADPGTLRFDGGGGVRRLLPTWEASGCQGSKSKWAKNTGSQRHGAVLGVRGAL